MAKKKARRVSTVFGDQKITTTPEVAAKIKSGEISPGSHTFSQQEGKVNFAPRRRATVGGTGIMPSASTGAQGSMATANTGSQGGMVTANTGAQGSMATAKTAGGQEMTPAQLTQMQEQKAVKIAPYKADIESLTANLNEMVAGLEAAEDDAQVEMIKAKIDAFKAAIGTTQGQ